MADDSIQVYEIQNKNSGMCDIFLFLQVYGKENFWKERNIKMLKIQKNFLLFQILRLIKVSGLTRILFILLMLMILLRSGFLKILNKEYFY